jgi:hypothetical protein
MAKIEYDLYLIRLIFEKQWLHTFILTVLIVRLLSISRVDSGSEVLQAYRLKYDRAFKSWDFLDKPSRGGYPFQTIRDG